MRNLFLLIAVGFVSFSSFAQSGNIEKTLKTKTTDVTVYLQGAQIQRAGELNLAPGNYSVVLKSLSALLDPNSINIKGTGDIKILSVQHRFDYLEKDINSALVDSIQSAMKAIESKITKHTNRIGVLNAKESLIASNKNLGSENVTSSQLLQMLGLYERELSAIKKEQSNVSGEITTLRTDLNKLRSQLNSVRHDDGETKSNIMVAIEVKKSTKASFEISYFVNGAGWYPKYRLNVTDITKPIELEYQAEVYQQTGEDWEDVKLRFSNAEPNQNKEAPELDTWYLDYARYTSFQENNPTNLRIGNSSVKGKVTDAMTGEALPGVNVRVEGTAIGTTTNLQGGYSITMPKGADQLSFSFIGMESKIRDVNSSIVNVSLGNNQQLVENDYVLSEVVVTSNPVKRQKLSSAKVQREVSKEAERTTSTTITRQTNVEFEVEKKYTIKSGNPQMYIDLKSYEMAAEYHYVAIPKLDKKAYLVAGIANWDQYDLMDGEAKLFFEGSFVGTSILIANTTIDTLKISLGNDKSISVEREKIDDFKRSRFIGSNRYKKLGFKITVRNSKSQAINLSLYDQVPVSLRDDIVVSVEELSKANYNVKTGELRWNLLIDSNQSVEKTIIYEVKYPKGEDIILE